MKEQESKPFYCQFCGAPQRSPIPSGTVQVKCNYCGGLLLVPPWLGGVACRCPYHPEKLASGKCNDCGNSYCEDCLSTYNLRTEHEEVALYLCPECLRRRQADKANKIVFGGIVFFIMGLPFLFLFWPFGALMIAAGAITIFYGRAQKLVVSEETPSAKSPEKPVIQIGDSAVDEFYERLRRYYIFNWGVASGIEMLEGEIMAYTRHGQSFQEAVTKVYKRQEGNIRRMNLM